MTPALPREDGTLNDLERKVFCKDSSGEIGKRICLDADSAQQIADAIENAKAAAPKIYNLSVPLALTEVSQALSAGVKQLLIRCRGNSKIQFSFVSGDSGTIFISIPPGTTYYNSNLNLASATIYLQCNKASQTVEILEWT